MLPPAFQESDGLDVLPSKINSIYNNNTKEADFWEAGKSTTRCEGLWVGEVLRNYSQGACQSGRKEDENPQDLSHTAISLHLSPDQSTIPALRRRQVSGFTLALNYWGCPCLPAWQWILKSGWMHDITLKGDQWHLSLKRHISISLKEAFFMW